MLLGLLLLAACGDATSSDSGATAGAAAVSPTVTSTGTSTGANGGTATRADTATATRTASPVAEATPTPNAAYSYNENAGGGGGKNIVQVTNRQNNQLVVRGSVQLNRISGPTVEPVNLASAQASCTDCQTIAVALQINLIGRDANRVTPRNAAVAVNVNCTRCVTIAVARQYLYSVDDPRETPRDAAALIRELDRAINEIGRDRDATLETAIARIDDVLARFGQLAATLDEQRDEDRSSGGDGTPTRTASPTATGTATPPALVTPAPAPTSAPTPTASPPSPTATTQPSPTPSPTASP